MTFVVILLGIPVGEYRTARPSDYIGTSQLDRWSPWCSPVHSPHRPTRFAPQNRRQAEVAVAYAAQRRDSGVLPTGRRLASSVRIYFSDDTEDIHSKNLADLAESFGRRQFTVEYVPFTPTGNGQAKPNERSFADSKLAGRNACGFDSIAFYAGRSLPDFQGFMGGVSDGCKNSLPLVIAGDDVTNYVATEDIRSLMQKSHFLGR